MALPYAESRLGSCGFILPLPEARLSRDSSGSCRQVSSPSIPGSVAWGKGENNNASGGCQVPFSFGDDYRTRFSTSSREP